MKLKLNIEFFTEWGEELYAEIEKPYRLEYAGNGIWGGGLGIDTGRGQR